MTAPVFPLDVYEYTSFVRGDSDGFFLARQQFARLAESLWHRGDDEKVAVTSSDAGRCAAAVQAEIRGDYDLPDADYASRDNGTLNGAWLACLLKVAIEARHPEFYCRLETDTAALGVGGHTDLAVYETVGAGGDAECVYVVEFKCSQSWSVRPPHVPGKDAAKTPANVHQLLQAGHRALADGASAFTVYVKGDGEVHAQGDYEVTPEGLVYLYGADDDTPALGDVAAEYARLASGEKDPSRDYQCASCRWSACDRNVNPQKPAPDLAAMLTASVEAPT